MVNDSYDFEFASVLQQEKRYDELWRYALPHANAGDSNAQCLLGLLCEHGLGVLSDLVEAERWLLKAAEQNNPVAWNNLGTFWLGRGELEKAKLCYRRAVELGFTMASPLAE
jgi:TPR repeat protein